MVSNKHIFKKYHRGLQKAFVSVAAKHDQKNEITFITIVTEQNSNKINDKMNRKIYIAAKINSKSTPLMQNEDQPSNEMPIRT